MVNRSNRVSNSLLCSNPDSEFQPKSQYYEKEKRRNIFKKSSKSHLVYLDSTLVYPSTSQYIWWVIFSDWDIMLFTLGIAGEERCRWEWMIMASVWWPKRKIIRWKMSQRLMLGCGKYHGWAWKCSFAKRPHISWKLAEFSLILFQGPCWVTPINDGP